MVKKIDFLIYYDIQYYNIMMRYLMGSKKTSLKDNINDKLIDDESQINELRINLGIGYSINTENSRYDCIINKLNEKNMVCVNFKKNIIVVIYLHESVGEYNIWSLCEKEISNLDQACKFIKSIYN